MLFRIRGDYTNPILFVIAFYCGVNFLSSQSVFAQDITDGRVEITPPDITEQQVTQPSSIVSDDVLYGLHDVGITTNDPNGVYNINNPQVSIDSNGNIFLSSDSLVTTAKTYPSFSFKGTISIQEKNIIFSLYSINPSDFPSVKADSIRNAISRELTTSITPSQYNTYGYSPDNMKCMMLHADQWTIIYDTKGSDNFTPPPYGLCPNEQGNAQDSNGSNGLNNNNKGADTITVSSKVTVAAIEDKTGSQAGGLVPCDGRAKYGKCGWGNLVDLVNKVIKYVIILTVPGAACIFTYAGFLLLSSGGSEEQRIKAKHIFFNVFLGIIIILSAVLVIQTLLRSLGVTSGYSSLI
ncbi:MAG: hypothetical protein JST76_07565 [Bacteroidetes bacterium]|nr:hypothetical protein [Bacteroidota bacterium]